MTDLHLQGNLPHCLQVDCIPKSHVDNTFSKVPLYPKINNLMKNFKKTHMLRIITNSYITKFIVIYFVIAIELQEKHYQQDVMRKCSIVFDKGIKDISILTKENIN